MFCKCFVIKNCEIEKNYKDTVLIFARKQGARQNGGVSVLYSSFSRDSSMQHRKKIPLLTNMCYKTDVKKWDD